MSTDSHETPRPLPARPNLRHLKDQAKISSSPGPPHRSPTLSSTLLVSTVLRAGPSSGSA